MDSNDKVLGVVGYFGLLFLVPLLAGKTEFTRYHANQALVLFIAEIILGVIAGILSVVIAFIPVVGLFLPFIISGAVGIISLVFMILGIVHAAQGEMKPLPVIGGFQILK